MHLQLLRKSMPIAEQIAPRAIGRFATKMFFSPLRYPIPEREQALKAQATRGELQVADERVVTWKWNENGKGPVLFLMHGWASRASQFVAIIKEALDRDCRIYALDAPAHGESTGEKTDVIQFADAIMLFQQQAPNFDYCIGHSMGGSAILLAMRKGLKPKHIALMAVPSIADEILSVYAQKMGVKERTVSRMKENITAEFGEPFSNYTAENLARGLAYEKVELFYDKNDKEATPVNMSALKKVIGTATEHLVESKGHARMLKDEELAKRVLDSFGL